MTSNNAMSEETAPGPKGLGGWLVLVILGLVISPIRVLHTLLTEHWSIFHDGVWAKLTTAGTAAYHPLWAPVIIFEIAGNVGIVALSVATLVFLLKRSRHTPRLAIAWLSWTAAFMVVDLIFAAQIPAVAAQPDAESTRESIRAVIAAAIWIPYFLVSKRVKATFVE